MSLSGTIRQVRTRVEIPLRVAALAVSSLVVAACSPDPGAVAVPPLPVDAGLTGDASPRPLAILADRVTDRIELYSITPDLEAVAAISVDENPGFIDEPFDLALSPARDVLYVVLGHAAGYQMGTLAKIRIADGARLGEVVLGEEPSMLALSSDGKRAYVSLFRNLAHPMGPWRDPGALVEVDTDKMQVIGQVEVCAAALGVALDEARSRAWVACAGAADENALAIVDVSSAPRLDRLLPVAPAAGAAYLVLDERHAFLTAQSSGELFVFDRETLARAGHVSFGSDAFPQRMALMPDAKNLLVAVDGGQLIAEVSTEALIVVDRVATPGAHPQGIAVVPDGRYALFTDENDLVHPGRLVRVDLTGLGSGGAHVDAAAPALVFPQAIVIVP